MTENRLLTAELGLSKGTKIYLVVDLGRSRADLKVKGMTLRTFPIRDWDLLGDAPAAIPSALTARSTFQPPQRPELKPDVPEPEKPAAPAGGKQDADPSAEAAPSSPPELQALELRDMPTEYTLELADGTRITVKHQPRDLWSRLIWSWFSLRWRVVESFRVLRGAPEGRSARSLKLVMDEADAQALYWAFPEGVMAVVVPAVR